MLQCTAGPQITLFHSTSFCFNGNEEKKKFDSQPGPWCVWSLQILPMSVEVFSGYSDFFQHLKDVHIRLTGMCKLFQS